MMSSKTIPAKARRPIERKRKSPAKPLSLYPLSFDEAVTDILKAKPERKPSPAKRERRT